MRRSPGGNRAAGFGRQLSRENKKFQHSSIKKGSTASRFAGSLQLIEDAGITTRCRSLSITELPLDGNALELDFVIRWRVACVPVEGKARDGNAKSMKTVLKHPEKHHVASGVKLADLNVARTGEVLTLPPYMAFLLTER